jgi:hypothetical protein
MFDNNALRQACREIVRNTLWRGPKPVDINDIADTNQINNLTDRYFAIAIEHIEFVEGQNRDPNMITRAVCYLANSHAIPPMKEDLGWFRNMLESLLELACPNFIPNGKSDPFLEDVKDGILYAESIE